MLLALIAATLGLLSISRAEPPKPEQSQPESPLDSRLEPFFHPPAELAEDLGAFRSPLIFDDGRKVETPEDWLKRREEILAAWHKLMGPWPPIIERPKVEFLEKQQRDGFTQHKVRVEVAPGRSTTGYLLAPDRDKKPMPAVVVVYYEPETGIGEGKSELRDFALQLARRGFVTLSIGTPGSTHFPKQDDVQLQPLSYLAYTAANCYQALAALPEVDPARVGIVGHSYGGKWAMFASCLYDKFACAAWSDGGVVFDESRGNVNYWEPWYLGYEAGTSRRAGIPSSDNPRTGAYEHMIEQKRDLHELHALMAPRPFLVSGGAEDPLERWRALNHAVAVNRLLGYSNRVALTTRQGHSPTQESNEQIYLFFEHFLKPGEEVKGQPQE
ncbi:MAG: prolyl oligopeptidase family serine peptidase [Pirellulaceae bacterium]